MQQVRAKINHLTHPSPSPSSIDSTGRSGGRPLGAIPPRLSISLVPTAPPTTSTSHHRLRRLRFRLDYGSTGEGKVGIQRRVRCRGIPLSHVFSAPGFLLWRYHVALGTREHLDRAGGGAHELAVCIVYYYYYCYYHYYHV